MIHSYRRIRHFSGYALKGSTHICRAAGGSWNPAIGFTVLSVAAFPAAGVLSNCRLIGYWLDANNRIVAYLRRQVGGNGQLDLSWLVGGVTYSGTTYKDVVASADVAQHYYAIRYNPAIDKWRALCGDSLLVPPLIEQEQAMTVNDPPAFPSVPWIYLTCKDDATTGLANAEYGPVALFNRPIVDGEVEEGWSRIFDRDIGVSGCWGHWHFQQPSGTTIVNYAKEGNVGDASITVVGNAVWSSRLWDLR